MTNDRLPEVVKSHIRKEMLGNFIINLLLNALIGWLIFRDQDTLPFRGEHAFGQDLAITALMLSALLGTIVVFLTRLKLRKAQLPPVCGVLPAWLLLHPLIAGVMFVALAGLLYLPLTLGFFEMAGIHSLDMLVFCAFKGVWAGLLAAAIVPMAIIMGLSAGTDEAAVA